jgi:hypothetical protein
VSVTASAGLIHSECGDHKALNQHLGITEDPAQKAGFFFVKTLHIFKNVVNSRYLGKPAY